MDEIKCIGCGITIQTENPEMKDMHQPLHYQMKNLVCRRCFRLRNYNEFQPVSLTGDDFLNILNGIGQKDGIVVKIVDIFDFNGSWISGFTALSAKKIFY